MKKIYHPPATPCERLLEHPLVEKSTKEALRKQLIELDPMTLLHGIRQGQSALAALSQGDPGNGPERQSLNEFLAKLPRCGEAEKYERLTETSPENRGTGAPMRMRSPRSGLACCCRFSRNRIAQRSRCSTD